MTKITSNSTKLSLTNINKKAKTLDTQSEVKVYSSTIDEFFTLKVDDTFKKTKVMKLVSELMSKLQYASRKEIDLQEVFLPYSILLMIKYFTTLAKEIPDDLESQITVMNNMINLNLLQPILECFPEDESEVVFNTINTTIEEIDDKYKEIVSRVEEIEHAFEVGDIEKIIDITDEDWIEMKIEEDEEDEKSSEE